MSEEFKNDKKRMEKFIEGSRDNAEGIGISLAVMAAWGITSFTTVPVPPEVIAAMSGVLGSIASRLKDRL